MPNPRVSANAPALPLLTRRGVLAATAAVAAASAGAGVSADPLAGGGPDGGLIELETAFRQAVAAHDAALRNYHACERRSFDLRPPPPPALTRNGPLGHLLREPWSRWETAELRDLVKDAEHCAAWDAARAALPIARAYEARLKRIERATGTAAAEKAWLAASDAVGDVCEEMLAAPARSLSALAVKARVVKTWAAPDWWDPRGRHADIHERLAAQILDAVIALADGADAA